MSEVTRKYLSALFEGWNREGIEYAVLRNHEQLPDEMGNDLDVLINPEQLKRAEQELIRTVQAIGGVIHNRARFSCVGLFFYDPDSLKQFHVDLFPSVEWRGFELIDSREMLSRRQPFRGFFIPDPVDEAVVSLLTKLLYAGYVKDRYKESVVRECLENKEDVYSRLQPLFGVGTSQCLVERILSEKWTEIEQCARVLRRKLIAGSLRRPLSILKGQVRDMARLIVRFLNPPGICVVLIGPDGCGKTSVGDGINERLEGTIHSHATARLHWKPRLLKSMSDRATPHGIPCTDPHAQPLRSKLLSVLYFVAHSLEIIPAWLIRAHPTLFKNNMVMIDRYFFDFIVDPRRFRLSIPPWLAWTVYRMMPKPTIVICLDAPADVLQSRKQEVSFEESARQRDAYCRVVEKLENGVCVDATKPLEDVITSSVRQILKRMHIRYAQSILR